MLISAISYLISKDVVPKSSEEEEAIEAFLVTLLTKVSKGVQVLMPKY